MSLSAATKALISLAKSKEGRGLLKKVITTILIIIGVLFAGILAIANSIFNANNDIVSRVFDGQDIEDISFDADPEAVQEIKNKLNGIQDGFSALDSSVAYINETLIVGDKLDANWVKSVYYAIYIERNIDYFKGSFPYCFCKDIPGEGIKKVLKDKNVVFDDLSEMMNIEITDKIKNNAESIYKSLNRSSN